MRDFRDSAPFRSRPAFLFLIVLILVAAPGTLFAQDADAPPIVLEAQAGFDGYYKDVFWVPVHISVSNSGPQIDGALEIIVEDYDSDQVAYRSEIVLPTRSNKELVLYVYLPRFVDQLQVQLLDAAGNVAASATSGFLDRMTNDELLYGVFTSELDELESLENAPGDRNRASVAALQLKHLPDSAAALNPLDVIVFHNIDSGPISSSQLQALTSWIESGGSLVVTGGPDWQRTSAGLAELLPVQVSGLSQVSDLPALSDQAGLQFRDPGPYLVSESTLQTGELLLHQDGLPLLARRPLGRGAVYFLALDPDLAPLADWDGAEAVWSLIAGAAPHLPLWGLGAQSGAAAKTAVSSLPSVALPSAVLLLTFLLVYIIAVGPANYLVLKRIGRRELAWATIPIMVLIFSAAAYLIGFRLKGNDVIINEMSIAYGSTDSDRLKVQSLFGLYSPSRSSYDFILPGDSLARPFSENYGSLAGAGNLDYVDWGSDVTMKNVRVDVSGVETFVADSYQDAPAVDGQASLHLREGDFQVDTVVHNNSDITLEDAALLTASTAMYLGDIEPGMSVNRTHSINRAALSGGTASISGPSPTVRIRPGDSPLAANYQVFLGTDEYYNDREVFPRWQLLQAISSFYGSSPHYVPRAAATLVAWSDESQLNTSLADMDASNLSTTLYFLELPLDMSMISGSGLTVPNGFLDWEVLGQDGVYNPNTSALSMGPGWIEFEFQPWPEFQNLAVSELALIMERATVFNTEQLPVLELWDWQEAAWIGIRDVQWGSIPVPDDQRFVGPANAVRVRVENNWNTSLEIGTIYPQMTGDVN